VGLLFLARSFTIGGAPSTRTEVMSKAVNKADLAKRLSLPLDHASNG